MDARYRVSTVLVFRREVSRLYSVGFQTRGIASLRFWYLDARYRVSTVLVFRREVSRLYSVGI